MSTFKLCKKDCDVGHSCNMESGRCVKDKVNAAYVLHNGKKYIGSIDTLNLLIRTQFTNGVLYGPDGNVLACSPKAAKKCAAAPKGKGRGKKAKTPTPEADDALVARRFPKGFFTDAKKRTPSRSKSSSSKGKRTPSGSKSSGSKGKKRSPSPKLTGCKSKSSKPPSPDHMCNEKTGRWVKSTKDMLNSYVLKVDGKNIIGTESTLKKLRDLLGGEGTIRKYGEKTPSPKRAPTPRAPTPKKAPTPRAPTPKKVPTPKKRGRAKKAATPKAAAAAAPKKRGRAKKAATPKDAPTVGEAVAIIVAEKAPSPGKKAKSKSKSKTPSPGKKAKSKSKSKTPSPGKKAKSKTPSPGKKAKSKSPSRKGPSPPKVDKELILKTFEDCLKTHLAKKN